MRVLVVLLLLLAGCGAVEQVPALRVEEAKATWRLTHTGRGADGWMAATGPKEAWLIVQHEPLAPSWSIMRWDGTSWLPAVLPKGFKWVYSAMFATSPTGDDLWLFGGDRPWQRVEGRWVARPWSSRYTRASVAVASRNEVWIAETGDPDSYVGAALSRWDGASWRRVPKPDPFDDYALVEHVVAAGPGELWGLVADQGMIRVIRRDGSRWALLPSPSMPVPSSPARRGCEHQPTPALRVKALAAAARNEAWALADIEVKPSGSCGSGASARQAVLHWNGTSWQQANLPLGSTTLTSIRADKVGGVWIGANPDRGRPYVLNLRKGRWTRSILPRGHVGRIEPIPGTTGLWVLAREGSNTFLTYELT